MLVRNFSTNKYGCCILTGNASKSPTNSYARDVVSGKKTTMKIWRINYYRMIVASIILIFHFSTSILFSQQDSHNSEFKKFDSYFSSSYNQIPSKLAIKICNLDLKNIYPNTEIYTSEKFQINNSKYSAYIIDVYMHPCNEYVVYVFSSIGNISDQLDLLWSCDHELSDPSYTYEEYKIINNSIIELKTQYSLIQ